MYIKKEIYIPFIVIIGGFFLFILFNTLNSTSIQLHSGCSETSSLYIKHKNDDNHFISYCKNMDKDRMKITSDYLSLGEGKKYFVFDYIGYPNNTNVSLSLEDGQGHHYDINDVKNSAANWRYATIEIPTYLQGKVRVIADDNATESYGWIGLGNVYITDKLEKVKVSTYIKTLEYILLFSLFITGIFSFFVKGRNTLKAFVLMSLFVGISSLVTFNVYLFSLKIGQILSGIILFFSFYGLIRIDRYTINISLGIFSLLASMMGVILFMAYSDVDMISNFQVLSANRWHHLPIDNWIPKIFANAILQGNVPSPLFGSWLSSDRPPLETGFFLIFSIFSYSDLLYLVTASGMQLLVIVFIAVFLMEYIKDKNYIFLLMILIFFNGFVFVHALFVWPKLLSALYQGIAFYFVYLLWISDQKLTKNYIFFGIASSLAFLSHGGSVFYLIALSILLLFTVKNKNGMKQVGAGFAAAVIVYIPWMLYQKLIDPPGDRLLKWHLAARNDVTNDSFLKVFLDYYEKLSLSDWLSLQASHFERIYYSFYINLSNIFSLPHNKFLDNAFFNTDYSFLFFSIFLSFLYFFTKDKLNYLRTFILLLLASYFMYTVIWSLILTRGTVIHQGSYFAWFAAFIATTLIVYHTSKYLFYLLGILNLVVFTWIYIVPYVFHKEVISGMLIVAMAFFYVWSLYGWIKRDSFPADQVT